jgi:nucleotide-binding universal stress UspA family protein
MLPLKKILLPIDFSDPSYEALGVAKKIAQNFSAELFLLHVVPPLPPFSPPPKDKPSFNVTAYVKNLQFSAEKSLHEVIDKKIGKELKVNVSVSHGNVAEKIVRYAHKKDIDLVILASHGTTGWKKNCLGSVAEKLVRISSVPALIIPKHYEEEQQR